MSRARTFFVARSNLLRVLVSRPALMQYGSVHSDRLKMCGVVLHWGTRDSLTWPRGDRVATGCCGTSMSGTICKFSCVKLGRLQDSTRLLLFEGRDRIGFS